MKLKEFRYQLIYMKEREEELLELKSNVESVTSYISGMPSSKNPRRLETKIAHYMDELEKLKLKNFNLIRERWEIEEKIDKLEQPYKNIIYFYYIKGYSISQLAQMFQYSESHIKLLKKKSLLQFNCNKELAG